MKEKWVFCRLQTAFVQVFQREAQFFLSLSSPFQDKKWWGKFYCITTQGRLQQDKTDAK